MEGKKYPKNKGRYRLEPKIRRAKQQFHNEYFINNGEEFDIKSFDIEKFIKKNSLRLIISTIIFALVFAINSLPFAFSKNLSQGIKVALNYNMNWKETILENKNIVPAMGNQIKKFIGTEDGAIKEENKFLSPVEGKVIQTFGDKVHPIFHTKIEGRGIEIDGNPAREIQAIDNGKVIQIQNSLYGGERIVIQHNNMFKGVYEGCFDTSVKLNQKIEKGDSLGKTKNAGQWEQSIFYFELWQNDKAINPLDYIYIESGTN